VESSRGSRIWWIAAALLIGLYGVLAVVVRISPHNGIDRFVFEWVAAWNVPFLDAAMDSVSWFTDLRPRLVVGLIGLLILALSGRYRLAAVIAAVAVVTAIAVNGLDLVGGIVAGRIRPNGAPFLAYPSGHTLGTIIQYALGIYLVFRLTLHRRLLVPLVALLALPIALVGPSRVLVGAHWSTDVLGAYLLGGASVIAVVLFLRTGEQRLADRGTLESLVRPTPGTSISEQS
jgi:undecaprenyl-diphosphatase